MAKRTKPRETPRRDKPPRRAARASNRRVSGKGEPAGKVRAPRDPAERRARNRTVLMLGLLALVNAYVFVWRDEGGLLGLSAADVAAIGEGSRGPLAPLADPLPDACGGDPVRIFAGLSDMIRVRAALIEGQTLRLARPGFSCCRARPKAMASAATFSVITLPAETMAPSPMATGATRMALEPTKTPAPMVVRCLAKPS